ncbi:hypothetical protein GSS87_01185 [Corynebacterium sp. 4HC-13]|uniref:Uncharacterized protein n=2 Tax=Corynebacterium anserum TaxID=2684406 RepID=A0A7G7YQW3_9CORY|nr:hypothetical protein [Corynebacterium anserum]MBC2681046.1 hypothetical protein [Corynebacterium anserum]QNH96883.1 hypothetical protein GP473_02395 [Corynebacterium anserum]
MIFIVLAVLATIGLAYWQWCRFTSAQGDFQNLGYALQWPIFGAFIVVVYRKYIQYERERLNGDEMAAVPKAHRESMTEIPEDFIHLPGQRVPTDLNSQEILTDDRRQQARKSDPSSSPAEHAKNTQPDND